MRKYRGIRHPLAVLSPCIAKKTEFVDTGIVTYNVVFSQLKQYIADNNIRIPSSSASAFDGVPALSGVIYPMPGGLKECLLAMNPDLKMINSEGVPVVYHNLDNYLKTPDAAKPDVFDILSCEYGCISGPGVPQKFSYFEMMDTMYGVKSVAFSRQRKQRTQSFGDSSKEVTQKTDTIKGNIEDIYAAINKLAVTLDSLKKDFEAAGNMGYEIFNISEKVHSIADDIQRIVNG